MSDPQQQASAKAEAASKAAAAGAVLVSPHSEHVAHALARMQASRARLRSALLPKANRRAEAGGAGDEAPSGGGFKIADIARLVWDQVRAQFRGSPSLGAVFDTVQQWWQRQPWQGAVSLAGEELQGAVAPLVRRHPVASVAAAAALGATVAVLRPWRWSLVSNQWQTLRAEALGTIRQQVFHVPLQMLLASLASLLVMHQASPADDGGAAPPADPSAAPPPQNNRHGSGGSHSDNRGVGP